MAQEQQAAIFMDFENVALSAEDLYGKCDLDVIMAVAETWGRLVIRRAYGDWARFEHYRQELMDHAFELTQLFRYTARHRKNAADIQMVVDALETAFTHPEVQVFVLVTGDSDFSAVARKLRAYGKHVVGVGLRQSTSEVLVKACDHFVLYDTLVEDTRTSVYRLERARQLLLDVMRMLLPQVGGEAVNASQLKLMMLKLDPTFNEADLGYSQFRNFLEAQSDLVKVEVEDQVLWASLKPSVMVEPSEDELLQYRVALSAAGLRLLDPHTRNNILLDLFALLEDAPGLYTLDEVVIQLKAKYDAENVLRSREEVRETAKLVRYADVFASPPQSWQLDPLTLKSGLNAQEFIDRSESAYMMVLLQNNLDLEPKPLADLLFGTLDQETRVEHLIELAQQQATAQLPETCEMDASLGAWACHFEAVPQLTGVFEDLDAVELEGPLSLERAAALHHEGVRVRMTDYEQARAYFLRAAHMVCELMQRDTPGASRMELEWYLASYCAASAGAHYFRFEYEQAKYYYLAFFIFARETQPAWDKVQHMIEPLLAFYFSLAAGIEGEMLEHHPGRTHPARMAVALYQHPAPAVRDRWFDLVRDLREVNPAVLRGVIQRLELLERTASLDSALETRRALEAIVTGQRELL